MVLDPRFKDRLPLESEKTIIIEKLVQLIHVNNHNNNSSAASASTSNNSGSKSKLRLHFRRKLGENFNSSSSVEGNARREIRQYFSEEVEEEGCNFLSGWNSQILRFPLLCDIARNFLAIPATQTCSERWFSNAGNIVTPLRTRLLPESLEELCFLQYNLK